MKILGEGLMMPILGGGQPVQRSAVLDIIASLQTRGELDRMTALVQQADNLAAQGQADAARAVVVAFAPSLAALMSAVPASDDSTKVLRDWLMVLLTMLTLLATVWPKDREPSGPELESMQAEAFSRGLEVGARDIGWQAADGCAEAENP